MRHRGGASPFFLLRQAGRKHLCDLDPEEKYGTAVLFTSLSPDTNPSFMCVPGVEWARGRRPSPAVLWHGARGHPGALLYEHDDSGVPYRRLQLLRRLLCQLLLQRSRRSEEISDQ